MDNEFHAFSLFSSGSWWAMITHIGWSLLGQSGEVDPMDSVDVPSVTLARLLYAGFLTIGVILLINMLIALLSNTYQRIQVTTTTIIIIIIIIILEGLVHSKVAYFYDSGCILASP